MMYRMALPVLAVLAAGGCAGRDVTSPVASPGEVAAVRLADAETHGATSMRSGTLDAVKDCHGFNADDGYFCEITASNVKEIKVGSRIYYLGQTAVFAPEGSDVILDLAGPGNNRAFGHCALDLDALQGLCTFSGGTGKFRGFEGSFVVSFDTTDPTGLSWDLNGPYSFGKNDDKD